MTKIEWIEQARQNRNKLESLIINYHPRSHRMDRTEKHPITAQGAELACVVVRESIKSENRLIPPIIEFTQAVDSGNINVINRLLNDAWFGVPESRSCWSIVGFKEAVELIEDPPED